VNIMLLSDESTMPCTLPDSGSDHVTVDGQECPHCHATPFRVRGMGPRVAADDRAYEASAACLTCGRTVGVLRAEPSTIFGIREDEAVLRHSRCRVY
jgi:hypothetical protein